MRASWGTALLLVATTSTSSIAAGRGATDLQVGHIISGGNEQVINGWQRQGGSHYRVRTTENYVTREVAACCVTLFTKGNQYLFAVTEPIARDAGGGVEAERIKAVWELAVAPGEESLDCNLMWIQPVASFSNGPGKVIRSVVYDGDTFTVIRWYDPGTYCSYDHRD